MSRAEWPGDRLSGHGKDKLALTEQIITLRANNTKLVLRVRELERSKKSWMADANRYAVTIGHLKPKIRELEADLAKYAGHTAECAVYGRSSIKSLVSNKGHFDPTRCNCGYAEAK